LEALPPPTHSYIEADMASPHGSDHDDDAAIEAAVAKDAFGLSSFTGPSNQQKERLVSYFSLTFRTI